MSITEETRRDSHNAIKSVSSSRRKIILEILGDKEMTANEIAEALYKKGLIPFYERNFAAPRLTELKAEGMVITTGKRFCKRTGRRIAVWKKAVKIPEYEQLSLF